MLRISILLVSKQCDNSMRGKRLQNRGKVMSYLYGRNIIVLPYQFVLVKGDSNKYFIFGQLNHVCFRLSKKTVLNYY